ncbi:uncharacterized protein LOC107044950 [Diachasma alloeum]|uniref:uncharacterized protein LOC107044950 n=1 Tax=Diachasma alloeum TaxID=454923 RepID=UPI000738235C|nr:uncharacterized protein LOC107044950 [Diachasma alloeum]
MESTGVAHKSSKKSSALTGEQRSKDLVNELYKEGHAADVHDQSLLAPSTSGQSVRLRKKLIEPKDSIPQKRDNEPDDELRELEPGLTPKKKCRICSNSCLDCAAKEEANELYQRKVLRLLRRILGQLSIATDGPPVAVEPLKLGDFKLPLKTLKAIMRLKALITVEMVQKLGSSHSITLFPSTQKTQICQFLAIQIGKGK